MTPDQALNLIDRGLSMVACNRQDHINFQLAVQVLRDAMAKADVTDPE